MHTEKIQTTSIEGRLIPYFTSTPKDILHPAVSYNTVTPNSIPDFLPTSTPIIYEVVENDTLTSIANQYSITLDDLIAANPGIDPNFLTIGLTLTIPIDGVISATLPTATPVAILLQTPVCYSQIDGSLFCISVVENNQDYAVENVTAEITLQSQDGENTFSQIAITPQNIINSGNKAAVSALFTPPIPENYIISSRLLSVIPVSRDDQRYLRSDLEIQEIEINADGQKANIKGRIEIFNDSSDEQQTADSVWVSVFAYDGQDNIAGIRKWVAKGDQISDNYVSFSLDVYSLGPLIEKVDVLTEVRP